MSTATTRTIRAPRGTSLSCKGWPQEAALRMLMNNLDPDVAERPEDLVVYGGSGRAARIQGMTWMAVENGRIVEGWDGWDATGLLVEIGAASVHPDVVRALTAAEGSGATGGQVSG